MAVYTTLDHSQISCLLSEFDLPTLTFFKGASSGVENTTYFLTLASGAEYVLTVFEHLKSNELLPYIQLTRFFHKHHLSVPTPVLDKAGAALHKIADKPVLLFNRSPGAHVTTPNTNQLHQVGTALAQLHLCVLNHGEHLPFIDNPCNQLWMEQTFSLIKHCLSADDQVLLQSQIALSATLYTKGLPVGIIHGDLFRDNVLFDNNGITAIIDFYNAGHDILLLDLAIAINDWCYGANIDSSIQSARVMFDSYCSYRQLAPNETAAWQDCLRVAASRLWLSRLRRGLQAQRPGQALTKDPVEYRKLLLLHLDKTFPL